MRNGKYTMVLAPKEYPGTRYRGRYCYEHHLVWWRSTGSLPGVESVIHHENEDTRDNRIENLSLLSRREHSSQHSSARGAAWVDMTCPACDAEFSRERRQTHLSKRTSSTTFCSRRCAAIGASHDQVILREYRRNTQMA